MKTYTPSNSTLSAWKTLAGIVAWLWLGIATSQVHAQSVVDGFDPSAEWPVFALALQTDGKILVGGNFRRIAGQQRAYLARLNVDGSLDTGFANTSLDAAVRAIAIQPDGKILVGGYFRNSGATSRNRILRLNSNGGIDAGFDPGTGADGPAVYALAVQGDGKIVMAGVFKAVNGQTRSNLARLNSNGTVDSSFAPSVDGRILALSLDAAGKIVIGGGFSSVHSQIRNNLARLNSDGSLDASFDPNANGSVESLLRQTDGKWVVGGTFTVLGGVARNRIARLNADASLDSTFTPSANSNVLALAQQADGKILVAGLFSRISQATNNYTRNRIARLLTSGAVDTDFSLDVDNGVFAVLAYADGSRTLIGGNFESVAGQTRKFLARLQ
ncbi:MAG: delta-60 repeat domain-containing protein [Rhodanobacteraceae bacterium]|nr:delta-60 repeat domain-containing protein [Rhodanobacteraceae bacterium]